MKKREILKRKNAREHGNFKHGKGSIKAQWSVKQKRDRLSTYHWVSMPHSHQKELFEICEEMWTRVSKRLILLTLSTQEIEDLRSAAMIRPFQKFALFDPKKGDLEVWVKAIMRRSLMNELRKILPNRRTKKLHEARTSLLRPKRIESIVMETGRFGEQSVYTINDTVDPRGDITESFEAREEIDYFLSSWPPLHARVARLILHGESAKEVVNLMGIDLNYVYVIMRKVKSEWRNWLTRA